MSCFQVLLLIVLLLAATLEPFHSPLLFLPPTIEIQILVSEKKLEKCSFKFFKWTEFYLLLNNIYGFFPMQCVLTTYIYVHLSNEDKEGCGEFFYYYFTTPTYYYSIKVFLSISYLLLHFIYMNTFIRLKW